MWLLTEIGVGNAFTKEQIRAAFPGIAQADRRIRDLRKHGWQLDTNREDVTLAADEQRFVRAGEPVWRPGARTKETTPLTDKIRIAVLAADGYQCMVCGIAGGETYPDKPSEAAVLSVSRRRVELVRGQPQVQFVSECKRCRQGSQGGIDDAAGLFAEIENLDDGDRTTFVRWARAGQRPASALDRLWSSYRRLPDAARNALLSKLTPGQ